MIRCLSLVVLLVRMLFIGAPCAQALEPPRVVVSYAEPTLEPVARQIQAELATSGHREVILEKRTPLGPCPARRAHDASREQIGILLRSDPKVAGEMLAEICREPQPNRSTVTTARGSTTEKASFAIIVTEALHGLSLGPVTSDQASAPAAKEETAKNTAQIKPKARRRHPFFIHTEPMIAFDIPTGKSWVGARPSVHFQATPNLGIAYDGFASFQPIEYSDSQIDLKSQVFWGRGGLFGSRDFGPLIVGWDATLGMFWNHVRATATAPRQGGTDAAPGAIAHLGGFTEVPAQGRFFVRTSLGLSTLLPRLQYQMSTERTPDLGVLLLEGGLGLGMRLSP